MLLLTGEKGTVDCFLYEFSSRPNWYPNTATQKRPGKKHRSPFSPFSSSLSSTRAFLQRNNIQETRIIYEKDNDDDDKDTVITSSEQKLRLPPQHVSLLILPGFGNDAQDYYSSSLSPSSSLSSSLVTSLQNRGWKASQIHVLSIRRIDWLLNVFVKGLWDVNFWKGTLHPTQPAFAWYLQRVVKTVQDVVNSNATFSIQNDTATDTTITTDDIVRPPRQIVLIGHSAGGWLARAALGFYSEPSLDENEKETMENYSNIINETTALQATTTTTGSTTPSLRLNRRDILGLVTLGAPQVPPPPPLMDMTRGALRITQETFPGAYFQDELFYLTVIGNATQGIAQNVRKSWHNPLGTPTTVTGFAYNSYQAVCGNGSTFGDGVVPIESAHLEDATQLTLPGVFHSINAPEQWYGSDAIIDSWHSVMLQEIERYRNKKSTQFTPSNQPKTLASRTRASRTNQPPQQFRPQPPPSVKVMGFFENWFR